MEHPAHERPPAYVNHDPELLKLPSVPQQDLRSTTARSGITLPNLQSVLASLPRDDRDSSINRLPRHGDPVTRHKSDLSSYRNDPGASVMSPTDTASVASLDDIRGRSASVVSLEDPAVRMAAEALSGLGSADFSRSPRNQSASGLSFASLPAHTHTHATDGPQDREPLLNLLVDAHPWVGGTINGSLSAYTTTKNYSPRFVQYGANLIERNIGTPVAHTVSTVGRRTGVESGLRRYLDSRRPSELEAEHCKRRRFDIRRGSAMEIDNSSECAIDDSSPYADGHEFLPAYRSSKPPSYREESIPLRPGQTTTVMRPRNSRSWSTQLMISTSGLGVALSENSLHSLTYCVRLLSRATDHVNVTMHALMTVLHEYDQTQEEAQQEQARRTKAVESGLTPPVEAAKQERVRQLAERIKNLCDEIWNTIKSVVTSVSTYAGGALPENARKLVKGQLLSIPQRWRFASVTAARQSQRASVASFGDDQPGSSPAATHVSGNAQNAAHRMIAFAEQGLDMMAQVSEVVNITLKSAEEWLQSLGRGQEVKKQSQGADMKMPVDGACQSGEEARTERSQQGRDHADDAGQGPATVGGASAADDEEMVEATSPR